MEKQIEIYEGDIIAKYEETEDKKQKLWDSFIEWCEANNAYAGGCIQNDDFVINAPEFMAYAIENIVVFEAECKE